eukprot:s2117_g9.t2
MALQPLDLSKASSSSSSALDINRDNARNVFRVGSKAGEEQLKELVQQLGEWRMESMEDYSDPTESDRS